MKFNVKQVVVGIYFGSANNVIKRLGDVILRLKDEKRSSYKKHESLWKKGVKLYYLIK